MTQTPPGTLAETIFDKTLHLVFSPVLVNLIQSLIDPTPDFSMISRYLAMDPVLAGSTLNLVNSPAYHFDGKITDINRAVIVLGSREVFKLVISLALQKQLRMVMKRPMESLCADWRLTVWSALAAEELALRLEPQRATDAYVAALLKDVSLLLTYAGGNEPDFIRNSKVAFMPAEGQFQREKEYWGVTHPDLSADVFTCWGMPQYFVEMVQHHHDLDNLDKYQMLTKCIIMATRWAEFMHGNLEEPAKLVAFEMSIAAMLGLPPGQVEHIRGVCAGRFAFLLTQLGIQEGPVNTRFYEHSLDVLQNMYFMSMDIKNSPGGLAGILKSLHRYLRYQWNITRFELALRSPDGEEYDFYKAGMENPPNFPSARGQLDGLPWSPGLISLDLAARDAHWGQLRLPKQHWGEEGRDKLPLFGHFFSLALAEYYSDQVPLERRSAVFRALPLPVALVEQSGLLRDANASFLQCFGFGTLPQRLPLKSLTASRAHQDELAENLAADLESFTCRLSIQAGTDHDFTIRRLTGDMRSFILFAAELADKNTPEEVSDPAEARDELTGLYTHDFFMESLARSLHESAPADASGFVVCRIPSFKQLTDAAGPRMVSALLLTTGKVLAEALKTEDVRVCRYGSSSFAILFPKADEETLKRSCASLYRAFSRHEPPLPPVSLSWAILDKTRDLKGNLTALKVCF